MRILSKSAARTTALALTFLALSCARVLPWSNEPIGEEVNLSFTLRENLIEFQTILIDNRPGRFILGTAAPRTIVDPGFELYPTGAHVIRIGDKDTIPITPAALDLRGAADAIVGSEAWRNHTISIDYRSGLVTYHKAAFDSGTMTIYRYAAQPTITVKVNGRDTAAIVDTTSPDTLVLPGPSRRGTANVVIDTTDFGEIDVQYADVAQARVGNRLLSRFLVTIDYGRRAVGLWRDPRIPLHETQ
jgi:hypothetical protein